MGNLGCMVLYMLASSCLPSSLVISDFLSGDCSLSVMAVGVGKVTVLKYLPLCMILLIVELYTDESPLRGDYLALFCCKIGPFYSKRLSFQEEC